MASRKLFGGAGLAGAGAGTGTTGAAETAGTARTVAGRAGTVGTVVAAWVGTSGAGTTGSAEAGPAAGPLQVSDLAGDGPASTGLVLTVAAPLESAMGFKVPGVPLASRGQTKKNGSVNADRKKEKQKEDRNEGKRECRPHTWHTHWFPKKILGKRTQVAITSIKNPKGPQTNTGVVTCTPRG